MGRISLALLAVAASVTLIDPGHSQDMVYGTDGSEIVLVTPSKVVGAGLPDQAGNADDCLKTSGTALSWGDCEASGELPPFDGAGKRLATNSANNAAVWVDPPGNALPAFDGAGKHLATNSTNNAAVWVTPPPDLTASLQTLAATVGTIETKVESVKSPTGASLANGQAWTTGSCTGTGASRTCITGFAAIPGGGSTGLPPYSQSNRGAVLQVDEEDTPGLAWTPASTVVLEGVPTKTGKGGNLLGLNSGATGLQWNTPSAAVLSGLPALTGHGGNCLKANSGATGLEFAACGGGSGGGGTVSLVEKASSTSTSYDPGTQALHVLETSNTSGFFSLRFFLAPAAGGVTLVHAFRSNSSSAGTCNVSRSNANKWSVTGCSPETGNGWTIYTLSGGGGSGGGTNPSIPSPTAAAKLQHLRVNAAGAAYELADPPTGLPGAPSSSDFDPFLVYDHDTSGAKWLDAVSLFFGDDPDDKQGSGDLLIAGPTDGSLAQFQSVPDFLSKNNVRSLPAYAGAGKILATNSANNGSAWIAPPASPFPAFAGAGKLLATNSANNGVAWIAAPSGGNSNREAVSNGSCNVVNNGCALTIVDNSKLLNIQASDNPYTHFMMLYSYTVNAVAGRNQWRYQRLDCAGQPGPLPANSDAWYYCSGASMGQRAEATFKVFNNGWTFNSQAMNTEGRPSIHWQLYGYR